MSLCSLWCWLPLLLEIHLFTLCCHIQCMGTKIRVHYFLFWTCRTIWQGSTADAYWDSVQYLRCHSSICQQIPNRINRLQELFIDTAWGIWSLLYVVIHRSGHRTIYGNSHKFYGCLHIQSVWLRYVTDNLELVTVRWPSIPIHIQCTVYDNL